MNKDILNDLLDWVYFERQNLSNAQYNNMCRAIADVKRDVIGSRINDLVIELTYHPAGSIERNTAKAEMIKLHAECRQLKLLAINASKPVNKKIQIVSDEENQNIYRQQME